MGHISVVTSKAQHDIKTKAAAAASSASAGDYSKSYVSNLEPLLQ
jgi:hypothetical protein